MHIFTAQFLPGTAETQLRWGDEFCSSYVRWSFLVVLASQTVRVKKLLKSVDRNWTYSTNKSRPVFLAQTDCIKHMMLCDWWWIPTKAESQWPTGEDRRAALATSGSTRFRRTSAFYRYLRCGDLRSSGVMERRNGPLWLRDDDDDDDDV